jgi:hypothetical protein
MTEANMYQLGYAEGRTDVTIEMAEKIALIIKSAIEAHATLDYINGLNEALRLMLPVAAIVDTALTDAE